MGRICVTARRHQKSQAGAGQRHRQRPFVTSTRIDLDRAFLGDGNQTRGSNNADSVHVVAFFWCSPMSVGC